MNNQNWAVLVPELTCRNIDVSKKFYCNIVGFSMTFEREEDRFIYLDLGGAQLMLEERHEGSWETGPLAPPFGRGINLQIEVEALQPILDRFAQAGLSLFREAEEVWYREDDIEHGQIEALAQDPDGYLLRFVEILGTRPVASPGPA
ncbi:bleomycin resistance protein [Azospirillum griseum]|uniref:Bleomycin resistance protein n=1 Tax=Azospirillum griseum TaxID=2496639 RepID=A0A431VJR9_9PROT|nr:VOC family protein [Azospirillum griseum]RTR20961.1 VOC family protein [Azospirillum griseum]